MKNEKKDICCPINYNIYIYNKAILAVIRKILVTVKNFYS